ncbi:hypothetical protein SAMN04489842_0692 [Natronobacterium texcoconense]|uniref:Uncharacterized protein n=1 Tax=Natronobacterium texcoconense TaxID=1095778 RepID=A0A1H1AGY9_NATTX|nr:hypothetical protein SAMN04489842_0692 [Natronobacterium texcoconense]
MKYRPGPSGVVVLSIVLGTRRPVVDVSPITHVVVGATTPSLVAVTARLVAGVAGPVALFCPLASLTVLEAAAGLGVFAVAALRSIGFELVGIHSTGAVPATLGSATLSAMVATATVSSALFALGLLSVGSPVAVVIVSAASVLFPSPVVVPVVGSTRSTLIVSLGGLLPPALAASFVREALTSLVATTLGLALSRTVLVAVLLFDLAARPSLLHAVTLVSLLSVLALRSLSVRLSAPLSSPARSALLSAAGPLVFHAPALPLVILVPSLAASRLSPTATWILAATASALQ